jgi:hypothetical protein
MNQTGQLPPQPQFQVVDAMLLDDRNKIHQRSRLCLPSGIAPPRSLKGEGDGAAVVVRRAAFPYSETRKQP